MKGLVQLMAQALMDLGIRVNSIMPGIFATPPMLYFNGRTVRLDGGIRMPPR